MVSRGADPKRVEVVFNSVDLDVVDGPEIKDDFKVKEGIENKFLVTYAGILSPFQGLDKILDAAKNLANHTDIQFYIVGDGMEKEHLEQRIADEKLINVALRTFLPRFEYLCLVKSSDISLVSLDNRMKAPCLPGKIINLMAVRQPILAMVSADTETAKVVTEAKCGVVVDSTDDQVIADAILLLKENVEKRKLFGDNGRKYMEIHMTAEVAVKQYENIIQ